MTKAVDVLSRRERQIMDVLFARGEATAGEIQEAMPDPPSYSAVRATLRVLEEKGHVGHAQEGLRYVYRPTVEPEQARSAAMKHMVATFFNGSVEQAAAALLKLTDTKLKDAEIDRLVLEVTQARKEGR
jgi:BlaI family transcriptional regulator, penicillinase repressor